MVNLCLNLILVSNYQILVCYNNNNYNFKYVLDNFSICTIEMPIDKKNYKLELKSNLKFKYFRRIMIT